MGRINRLYERIFNSPRNFDRVSIQKTKHLLIQFCILGVLGWIIFFTVLVYDVLNQQVFVNNEIWDNVEVPQFSIYFRNTNIDRYSLNNLTTDTDFNQLDYDQVSYCDYYQTDDTFYCQNSREENKNFNISTSLDKITVEPFNITIKETYINLNIQTSIGNGSQSTGFILIFGDLVWSLSGPMKAELLFKTEVMIENDVKTIKYIPNLVTSLLDELVCEKYNNNLDFQNNCSSITLSIIYQSNIVPHFTLETGWELLFRILINTFSIGKLSLTLLALVFSFYSKKLLFKKKTSWFENSVRDAVLYHFHFHVLEHDKPSTKKEKLTKLERSIDQGDSDKLLNRNEKKIKRDQETMGSESVFKRLLESVSPQDKYSIPLSRFSLIQYIVMVIVLIGIGAFIAIKDLQNILVQTVYTDMDFIQLPSFDFAFESVRNSTDTYLLETLEYLPNGANSSCTYTSPDSNNPICNKTINYPEDTIDFSKFPEISYYGGDYGSISLGKNQSYSFFLKTNSSSKIQAHSQDLTYLILYLNDIVYYIRPFSNISIELTKSIYNDIDGTTKESYDPSVTVIPLSVYSGGLENYTLIYMWYSSNVVSEMSQETTFQLLKRTFTDFSSFISPTTTVVGLFFTKILIKIFFKYSTAHVDSKTREAIIYHLRNYEKYKPIFRKNTKKLKTRKSYDEYKY
ncbi:hypothetical protein RB653_008413 [Dictyostelium firmibasis]|uniref:Uncharacterized protein n=1 Tax=Dictyostelium firmibasis TaxID=79012 RepID=A0AAN7U0A4_9MYCE